MHDPGLHLRLREVFRVQSYNEICVPTFRADTERVILRVRRNRDRLPHCYLDRFFTEQVDEFPDYSLPDATTSHDLLVLIKNVFCVEPGEVARIYPLKKKLAAFSFWLQRRTAKRRSPGNNDGCIDNTFRQSFSLG